MNLGQNKVILPTPQSHRRLWFTSIVTLFIFATSISAYFLVKHSQDIRKSASEPYASNCTCIYNSSCSAVGMKPCEGQCNPTCNYPTICCQPITEDFCTQGERYCVDANRIATCKPDRSGYTITNCASGSSCNSQQKLCIANPTPNPTLSCSANGGQCMSVSCASVYMQSIAGSCSNASYNCCKTIQQFACNAGAKECVNSTTRRYCNNERTAWVTVSCPNGSTCSDGTCVFPCQGTCYTNSSCSAIGKVPANGTCRYNTSVCCKEAPASTPTSTPTTTSTTTSTCEGTCYTNSSCMAIGKVEARGSCLYPTSICCKEKTITQVGSLTLGESCKDDSECASGNCTNNYISRSGEVNYLGPNYFVCAYSPSEQDQYLDQRVEQEEPYARVMGMVAVSFLPGVGPVVQIASAVTQGVQAVYTCSELAQMKNNPNIDQAVKDQFATACMTSSISAVTGTIGGGASVVSTFATGLSTGTQLALSGVSMVDNIGNLAVSGINANNVCQLYGSHSSECYMALGNAGVAVGSTALSGYQFGKNTNVYLNQQVNQMLAGTDSWGHGYQAVDSEVVDYFYPNKSNIIADQIQGKVYSPTVEDVSALAQSYIKQGMDPYLAIAQATNETMPPYWTQVNAAGTPVNVPAGSARSLEELVSCKGGVCRHFTQLSTPVANNMGYDADFNAFRMLVDTPTGQVQAGHAVTLVKNLDGTFGVIDATNPTLSRSNIVDYINNIESLGWHPISDFSSATAKDYTFQVIH